MSLTLYFIAEFDQTLNTRRLVVAGLNVFATAPAQKDRSRSDFFHPTARTVDWFGNRFHVTPQT